MAKDKFNNCKSENEEARIIAKSMLKTKLEINFVAQFTGLSINEVRKIKDQINSSND